MRNVARRPANTASQVDDRVVRGKFRQSNDFRRCLATARVEFVHHLQVVDGEGIELPAVRAQAIEDALGQAVPGVVRGYVVCVFSILLIQTLIMIGLV